MECRGFLICLGVWGIVSVCPMLPAASAPVEAVSYRSHYRVLVDGDDAGSYVIDFTLRPDGFIARTRMSIRVDVVMVTVFRYEQQSEETWLAGQLFAFAGRTNNNGRPSVVTGRSTAQGFEIRGPGGVVVAPDDVMTASFWSREILSRRMLFDPEDGTLAPLAVREAGRQIVQTAGSRAVNARAYHISTFLTGTVWYGDNGEWLGAAFVREGHAITYIPDR